MSCIGGCGDCHDSDVVVIVVESGIILVVLDLLSRKYVNFGGTAAAALVATGMI